MVTEALSYSSTIGIIGEEIKALGGEVSPETIRCMKTSNPFALSSFQWTSSAHGAKGTIVVHAQNVATAPFAAVQQSLVHELIHAFDSIRADVSSCKAIACSEIRAYRIDRSCDMKEHLSAWLGRTPAPGPFPSADDCLRTKATAALRCNHPRCAPDADQLVNATLASCRKDLEPVLHERVKIMGFPDGPKPFVA